MRAMWVRVRWGAFCMPGCLRAWLSAYLMSTLLRGGLLRFVLLRLGVLPWKRCKKSLFGALVGIFMAFEFCVIYISVKYLIPFYFGNCCGIKF